MLRKYLAAIAIFSALIGVVPAGVMVVQASNDGNNDDNNNDSPQNRACYNAGFANGRQNNPYSQTMFNQCGINGEAYHQGFLSGCISGQGKDFFSCQRLINSSPGGGSSNGQGGGGGGGFGPFSGGSSNGQGGGGGGGFGPFSGGGGGGGSNGQGGGGGGGFGPTANPSGSNMTAGSNMTGPAANTTGAAPTANPAGHQLGKDNPQQVG
jgi:hypothetical protein